MKKSESRQLMKNDTAPGTGNPDKEIRVEWHCIDGTMPVPLHWHTYCEFEFVESGEGIHAFNNVRLPLQKGSAYLCLPDDFHKVENAEGSVLSVINFKFPASLMDPELFQILNENSFQHHCTVKNDDQLPFSHMVAFLSQLVSKPTDAPESDLFLNDKLIHATLNQLLSFFLLVCKKEDAERSGSNLDRSKIQKAMLYIHHHFCEDISENTVATKCGLTAQYFSNLFKEEMHGNYSDYLLKLRLNYARNLIETGGTKNVKELTSAVGFSSASYFIKRFRERFGLTPKELMKQKQKAK